MDLITLALAKNSAKSSFFNNMDIHREYDATTNANYTIIRVYRDKLDGTKQFPLVYAPNGIDSGTKSTYDMNREHNFCLAINAGLFNMSNNKPDGIVIQSGKVLQNSPALLHSARPLYIDADGTLHEGAIDADAYDLVAAGAVSAVCGFMAIIKDYKAVPSSDWTGMLDKYTEHAPRQIIGQYANGDYAIITCEGRGWDNSDGWTIEEAQAICIKWGLKFAYNLDGGGSTETMLGLKHLNSIYENTAGRIVPTFIVFNGSTTLNGTSSTSSDEPGDEPSNEPVIVVGYGMYIDPADGRTLPAIISMNPARATAVALSGDAATSVQFSDPISNTTYYLRKLPSTATKIKVTSPGHYSGCIMFNIDPNSGRAVKTFDSGWSTAMGYTEYTFEAGVYEYYCINFKNSNNTTINSDDTVNWSIVVE